MGAFDGFADNSPNFTSWLQQLLGSLQNRPQSGNYMSQLQPMLGGNASPTPPPNPPAGALPGPPPNPSATPSPPPNPPATASPPPNPPSDGTSASMLGGYGNGPDNYTQALGALFRNMR